jgi:hypothetical protein
MFLYGEHMACGEERRVIQGTWYKGRFMYILARQLGV